MKILAYLLYGSRQEYKAEVTFSVLSALRLLKNSHEDIKVVVLTDQEDVLSGFPVELLALTAHEMMQWTHNGTYMHRAKPCAILKILNHYGVPVVLTDTDTYFTDDPSKLFRRISHGKTLMHSSDGYRIGDSAEWQPIVDVIEDFKIKDVRISRETEMLNSGVIGIDPQDSHLLETALDVLDRLWSIAPVFNLEQLAVTVALQSGSQIARCEDVVAHYWGYNRPFLHLKIERFLAANSSSEPNTVIAESKNVDVKMPPMLLLDRFVTKVRARLHRWTPDYSFANLCYRTALWYSKKDSDVATLWVENALHALKQCVAKNQQPDILAESVKRDFPQLQQGKLNQLAWLKPVSRAAWEREWHQPNALN